MTKSKLEVNLHATVLVWQPIEIAPVGRLGVAGTAPWVLVRCPGANPEVLVAQAWPSDRESPFPRHAVWYLPGLEYGDRPVDLRPTEWADLPDSTP